MVGVSASIILPLNHKVQKKISSGTHPGGPGNRAVEQLCVFVVEIERLINAVSSCCHVTHTQHLC